jgi:hypothetical protein
MTPEEQETLARDFLKERVGLDYDDLDGDANIRAKQRLMSPDFTWSPNKPLAEHRTETTFADELQSFCKNDGMHVYWQEDSCSHLFFDADVEHTFLVIRRQRAGNCYMHAVAVWADRRKVPLAAAKASRCIIVHGSSVHHMHVALLGGCAANGNVHNGSVE